MVSRDGRMFRHITWLLLLGAFCCTDTCLAVIMARVTFLVWKGPGEMHVISITQRDWGVSQIS